MKTPTISDESLVRQVKEGSRTAFNMLYERYWGELYQAANRVLLDEELSKDALQEIFLDFWVRKETLDVQNLSGYLYGAVRFQCLKQLRKANNLDIHEWHFEHLLHANPTEEQLNVQELREALARSLAGLPPKYRQVYEMSRVQHLSNKEIADQLNLSQRTVEWYLQMVLKHLRGTLTVMELLLLFFL